MSSSEREDGGADVGEANADERDETETAYGSAEAAYGSAEAAYGSAEAAYGSAEAAYGSAGVPPGGDMLPIDFNTFVLSLSSTALMNLGVGPDPMTGEAFVNLPLARQTIDLVALLEEKTKGNLTGEEERLLGQVLYDLRMRYVAATKR